MRKIRAIVSNKQVTSQGHTTQLNPHLTHSTIQDNEIVEFYLKPQPLQLSRHIIYPITINQPQQSLIFATFGIPLIQLSQQELAQLSSPQFVKQVCMMYHQLSSLRPAITLENIYFLSKQPFKIKLEIRCVNEEQYLINFRGVIKKISWNKKQMLDLVNKIQRIQDIKQIYSQHREGISLLKLLQLKFVPSKPPYYQIQLEQNDKNWIFNTLGFQSIPKHQLIYNGIQYNFDPIPLLKAIFKNQVLYVMQTIKGNKILFYPGVKYQSTSSSIFGSYLSDKQKKSTILGLNKKSVHQLEEEQFAVGYGSEILLAIGKVDIVISAFNVNNICYFPISYRGDEKSGVVSGQDLLGSNTRLKQMQVYRIS